MACVLFSIVTVDARIQPSLELRGCFKLLPPQAVLLSHPQPPHIYTTRLTPNRESTSEDASYHI